MKAVVQHCYGPPDALAELIESGKVTSVIDWTYPQAEVPRGHPPFRAGTHRGRSSSLCRAQPARRHFVQRGQHAQITTLFTPLMMTVTDAYEANIAAVPRAS